MIWMKARISQVSLITSYASCQSCSRVRRGKHDFHNSQKGKQFQLFFNSRTWLLQEKDVTIVRF